MVKDTRACVVRECVPVVVQMERVHHRHALLAQVLQPDANIQWPHYIKQWAEADGDIGLSCRLHTVHEQRRASSHSPVGFQLDRDVNSSRKQRRRHHFWQSPLQADIAEGMAGAHSLQADHSRHISVQCDSCHPLPKRAKLIHSCTRK